MEKPFVAAGTAEPYGYSPAELVVYGNELSVQKRVDNRLRFLTILSAVLMPLTLISGIYGMNFSDLPGMGVPDGHLFVIGFMLATALLTGIYLFWRGWFE